VIYKNKNMKKIPTENFLEDKVYHIYLNNECIHHNLEKGEFDYWMLQHKGVSGISYESVRGMVTTDDHSC